MSCWAAPKPSACSIRWRRATRSWSRNWCRRFSPSARCSGCCSSCCGNGFRFAIWERFSRRWSRRHSRTEVFRLLVEAARQALGRRLTQPLVDLDGTLRVFALEPALEEELLALHLPGGLGTATDQRPRDPGAPPDHGFFEISHGRSVRNGPARAPLCQSGALSPAAVAGADAAAADGDCSRGNSTGSAGAGDGHRAAGRMRSPNGIRRPDNGDMESAGAAEDSPQGKRHRGGRLRVLPQRGRA